MNVGIVGIVICFLVAGVVLVVNKLRRPKTAEEGLRPILNGTWKLIAKQEIELDKLLEMEFVQQLTSRKVIIRPKRSEWIFFDKFWNLEPNQRIAFKYCGPVALKSVDEAWQYMDYELRYPVADDIQLLAR